MTGERDPRPDAIVRTALQLLPVPDHDPGFWAGLDDRLDGEAPRPARPVRRDERRLVVSPLATAVPVAPARGLVPDLAPDASLALVPPALRQRSNLVLCAVAVAAALMVAVAGTTLVRERSADDLSTAAGSDAEREALISSTSTSTPVASAAATDASTEAVLAWVKALGAGDTSTAWDGLGPTSKAHFGSESAFAAEGSALAEGYGAWSAATPDDVLVTLLASGGEGDLLVVTLVGSVSQEGTEQRRADAFPVRIIDGAARLEPFAFAGELEFVVPEPVTDGGAPAVVHAGDELVVVVPRGVEAPTLRLDDGEALVCGEAAGTELAELEDAPGQRCSFRPAGGIPSGARVLTVAFLAPDGAGVAAESVLFEAA